MTRLLRAVASLFHRHGCPWCPEYRTHSLSQLAHHYRETHADVAA